MATRNRAMKLTIPISGCKFHSCNSLKKSISLGSLAVRPCRAIQRGTVAGRAKRMLHPATMKNRLIKNRIGLRYGRLLVISFAFTKRGNSFWNCQCDCGSKKTVLGFALQMRPTTSCGCFQRECAAKQGANFHTTTHGHSPKLKPSPTYKSWQAAKDRCTRKDSTGFKYYGGRGIKICGRWINSFENFLKDMGIRPIGKSIERKNTNGNYTPKNCKWATPKEQQANRRDRNQKYK